MKEEKMETRQDGSTHRGLLPIEPDRGGSTSVRCGKRLSRSTEVCTGRRWTGWMRRTTTASESRRAAAELCKASVCPYDPISLPILKKILSLLYSDSPYSTGSLRFLPVPRRQDCGGGKNVAAPLPAILFRTKIPTCDGFNDSRQLADLMSWLRLAGRRCARQLRVVRIPRDTGSGGLLSSCFISVVVAGFIYYNSTWLLKCRVTVIMSIALHAFGKLEHEQAEPSSQNVVQA